MAPLYVLTETGPNPHLFLSWSSPPSSSTTGYILFCSAPSSVLAINNLSSTWSHWMGFLSSSHCWLGGYPRGRGLWSSWLTHFRRRATTGWDISIRLLHLTLPSPHLGSSGVGGGQTSGSLGGSPLFCGFCLDPLATLGSSLKLARVEERDLTSSSSSTSMPRACMKQGAHGG